MLNPTAGPQPAIAKDPACSGCETNEKIMLACDSLRICRHPDKRSNVNAAKTPYPSRRSYNQWLGWMLWSPATTASSQMYLQPESCLTFNHDPAHLHPECGSLQRIRSRSEWANSDLLHICSFTLHRPPHIRTCSFNYRTLFPICLAQAARWEFMPLFRPR